MIVDQKLNKQFVGVYLIDGCIDGTQLATTTRPNKVRRVFTNLLLGWKWISIKKLKETPQKPWNEKLKEWFLKLFENIKNKIDVLLKKLKVKK